MPDDRVRIDLLGPQHDRTAFSCDVAALDDYLHRYAVQDVRRRLAVVYVLVDTRQERIAAYYTLRAYAIDPAGLSPSLARRLPRRPVPAVLLGRLAVDLDYRGQGFGGLLLIDALGRALEGSDRIGAMAVVVDAKDDATRAFYERYGFQRFSDDPYRLFLPMETIRMLVASST